MIFFLFWKSIYVVQFFYFFFHTFYFMLIQVLFLFCCTIEWPESKVRRWQKHIWTLQTTEKYLYFTSPEHSWLTARIHQKLAERCHLCGIRGAQWTINEGLDSLTVHGTSPLRKNMLSRLLWSLLTFFAGVKNLLLQCSLYQAFAIQLCFFFFKAYISVTWTFTQNSCLSCFCKDWLVVILVSC